MAKLTESKLRAARPGAKLTKLFDANGLYAAIAPAGGVWWRLRLITGKREQHLSSARGPKHRSTTHASAPRR